MPFYCNIVTLAITTLSFSLILFHFGVVILYNYCVHLVNQYNEAKGYLDTYDHNGHGGFGVEKTNTPDRDEGSGTWRIADISGKGMGVKVFYGDGLHIVNQYDEAKGHLEPYGNSGNGGFGVETSNTPDPHDGSRIWKIVSKRGFIGGVRSGDLVHLINQYNPAKGYLDTYGHTGCGGFGVETTSTKDRDNGSGTWRIITATAMQGCTNL